MLYIDQKTYDTICHHGEDAYPHECCGLLSVEWDPNQQLRDLPLTGLIRMPNANTESPENRYFIDPKLILKAERDLDDQDRAMVGFYHSHPDHPARPSKFDLDHAAGPAYWYLIVSVHQGKKKDLTAWRLSPDEKEFWPEEIRIIGPAAQAPGL